MTIANRVTDGTEAIYPFLELPLGPTRVKGRFGGAKAEWEGEPELIER